jgi:hypothetical protein
MKPSRIESVQRVFHVIFTLRSTKQYLTVATLAITSTVANAQSTGAVLPIPHGLNPCKVDDAVALAEKRVAPSIGAEYLACFLSSETVSLQATPRQVAVPAEYAIVLHLMGGPYGPKDIADLFSAQREQWKTSDTPRPLSGDYLTWLNSVINGTGSSQSSIKVIKPVLVSIDSIDNRSYDTISIREYTIEAAGTNVRSIKASATAIVLQGSNLVRLEMIRELRAPADVDDIRAQIAAWSRAVAADATR